MKKILLLCSFICALSFAKAQVFIGRNAELSFYSKTPVENIDATSKSGTALLNTATKDVLFNVAMRSFKFKKDLMEEHFNEKYVESDKYPDASFKGKINESIDFSKDGTYPVTVTGTLKIHGVEKPRTEKGSLTIQNGKMNVTCDLKVKCADFKIEIPKLVFQNIAETIDVKINADLSPYKK